MTRRKVVLPQPDGPMKETNSPRSMSRLTSTQRDDVAVIGLEGEAEADTGMPVRSPTLRGRGCATR
jgi:hypothetical protein